MADSIVEALRELATQMQEYDSVCQGVLQSTDKLSRARGNVEGTWEGVPCPKPESLSLLVLHLIPVLLFHLSVWNSDRAAKLTDKNSLQVHFRHILLQPEF